VIDSSFYGGLQIMASLHEARLIQDGHKIGFPRPNAGEGLEVRGYLSGRSTPETLLWMRS
jgi:hypothetical protein